MRGVDALAIWKSIDVLSVTRGRFRKLPHAKQGSSAIVQSFATFLRSAVVLGQLIENYITVLVDLFEKIRTPDPQQRFGHARILRVVVDQCLPMRPRFSKRANTQIDRRTA